MDWYEQPVVTLAKHRASRLLFLALLTLLLILPFLEFLHVLDVAHKWVSTLLHLTTADGRQDETRILIEVAVGCVYFTTRLAGEVFLCLSVL